MKSNILELYFEKTTDEELLETYVKFNDSKCRGVRCKALVPCAEWIQKVLVGFDLSLSDCLCLAEKCLFGEIAKRYFYLFSQKKKEEIKMIEHDGCDSCKHFNTSICVPEESPCFDCEYAHKRKTLTDKYEPMTRGDRIKNMTDEELAEFLSTTASCDNCRVNCEDKDNNPSMSSCVFRHLEWIQQVTDEYQGEEE